MSGNLLFAAAHHHGGFGFIHQSATGKRLAKCINQCRYLGDWQVIEHPWSDCYDALISRYFC